jgi:hypothetical protein
MERLQQKNAQLSDNNAELQERAGLLQRTLRIAELRGAVGLMSYRATATITARQLICRRVSLTA